MDVKGPAHREKRQQRFSVGYAIAVIDHEIRQLLEEPRERVRGDLTAKRPTLEALAALLIEHEIIDRTALDRLLADDNASGRRTSPISQATVAT